MIFVDRNEPAPASLTAPAATAEAAAAANHYQGWNPGDPSFEAFHQYRGYDVQEALKRIFKNKCAYCEKPVEKPFDVEHYRPKLKVADSDHSGYWWLALAWSNLLPSCAGCNQGLRQHVVTADMSVEDVERLRATPPTVLRGKATQFPVGGQRLAATIDDHFLEEPHLIDPTRTDPEPHLIWRTDTTWSVVEPGVVDGVTSIEGQATIDCVALNRVDLVQSRTQSLEVWRAQGHGIMARLRADGVGAGAGAALETALFAADLIAHACRPDQPFAGAARAFMAGLRAEIAEWAAENIIDEE